MVGSGVDKDPTLIPGSTLDSDVFMNVAQALQLTVTDHDGYRSGEKKQNKRVQFKQLPSTSRFLCIIVQILVMQLQLVCAVCKIL